MRADKCKRTVRMRRAALIFLTAAVLALAGCASKEPDGKAPKEAETEAKTETAGHEAVSDLWYYEAFDENGKAACDAFLRSSEDPFGEEPVPITDGSGRAVEISIKDLDTAYQGFLYDHPELFWLSGSYSYRVSRREDGNDYADAVLVTPIWDSEEELKKRKEEFENAALALLPETGAEDSGCAQLLYDRLAEGTQYAEEALYDDTKKTEHTAYGAIAARSAVCDGYALAYKYLLNLRGIRCVVIPGESEGAPHVWNTVYWDGRWHETDLTWDAASEGNDRRQYFDLTTEEMDKDHNRETEKLAGLAPVS